MIKFIGGLRWSEGNSYNATIPFVTLEITNEHYIITRTFFGFKLATYVLSLSDIECLTIKSFLFSKGILFEHKNKNVPKFLLFWTFQSQRICNILQYVGIKLNIQNKK